jgi:hypothetical protein
MAEVPQTDTHVTTFTCGGTTYVVSTVRQKGESYEDFLARHLARVAAKKAEVCTQEDEPAT